MSFVDFLMKYYVYILVVLVILIVGVIGFLVDSRNSKKKKMASGEAMPTGDASNVNSVGGVNGTNVVNNADIADGSLNNMVNNNQGVVLNNEVGVGVNSQVNTGDMSVNNQEAVVQEPVADNQVQTPSVMDIGTSSVQAQELSASNVMPAIDNQVQTPSVMDMGTSSVQAQELSASNVMPVANAGVIPSQADIGSYQTQNSGNSVNNVVQSSVSNEMPLGTNTEQIQNSAVMPGNATLVSPVQGSVSDMGSMASSTSGEFNQSSTNVMPANNASLVMPEPVANNNVTPIASEPVVSNVAPVSNQMANSLDMGANLVQGSAEISNGNVSAMPNVSPVVENNLVAPVNNNLVQNESQASSVAVDSNKVVTSDGAKPFDVSSLFPNN